MPGDRRVRVLAPPGGPGARIARETKLIRAATGAGGVAFLLFVQDAYTGIAAPDTRWACGEARNRYARAMSSTLGQDPWSASGIAARFAGVSMMLGTTQLTVIPVPLVSSAAIATRCSTPSLLTE